MSLAETERLIIRHWTLDDIPDYHQVVADPEVTKYLYDGQPHDYELAKTYVEKHMALAKEYGWSRFVVVNKTTNEFMGFCGYFPFQGTSLDEVDFGWRYAKKFWNQGYGTEAAKAVLQLGVEQFKFPRIVSTSFPENRGSIRIMQKIGMHFEKDIVMQEKTMKMYVKLTDFKQ